MKRLALSTAFAAVALTGATHAADLKAPVYKAPIVAPAYNWSGFYLGVNLGLGVGENATAFSILPGAGFTSFNAVTAAPAGVIGGVQAGYNWQFGNWVLGVEADFQGSGQSETANCLLICAPGVQAASIEQKLNWFGTARGRIGYDSGGVMTYYTGGVAYGDVKTTINETLAGIPTSVSFSDTRTGWTLGSGIEAALGGNWSGKLEYLYIDLGSLSGAYAFGGFNHLYSQDVRSHVFRAGVNYRIGGPLMAPQPLANWGGLYAGVNLGSGLGRAENHLVIASAPAANEQFTSVPNGFIGGVQAGYNWQAANWVFGIEADFQGSSQKDTVCVLVCSTPAGALLTAEQSMPWFGTLRGRIGYATGPSLLYLTGGLAYGKIESDVTELLGGVVTNYNFSETKAGWTLGGGVERPFDLFGLWPYPGWTAKAEYLYVDLGSAGYGYVQAGIPHVYSTDVTSHVFRAGINYRFGGGPIVARY